MERRYVERGSVYKHYKGGHYYVSDLAEHTETGEIMVVYHELYTDESLVYVRPSDMFLSEVEEEKEKENPTNKKYRFEKVDYSK